MSVEMLQYFFNRPAITNYGDRVHSLLLPSPEDLWVGRDFGEDFRASASDAERFPCERSEETCRPDALARSDSPILAAHEHRGRGLPDHMRRTSHRRRTW